MELPVFMAGAYNFSLHRIQHFLLDSVNMHAHIHTYFKGKSEKSNVGDKETHQECVPRTFIAKFPWSTLGPVWTHTQCYTSYTPPPPERGLTVTTMT